MPVRKCPNGKWRIGNGPCVFTSKEKAEKAWVAVRIAEHSKNRNKSKG